MDGRLSFDRLLCITSRTDFELPFALLAMNVTYVGTLQVTIFVSGPRRELA